MSAFKDQRTRYEVAISTDTDTEKETKREQTIALIRLADALEDLARCVDRRYESQSTFRVGETDQ